MLRTIFHAALGGIGVVLVSLPAGIPINSKTVLIPAAVSALTSVISLFTQPPK